MILGFYGSRPHYFDHLAPVADEALDRGHGVAYDYSAAGLDAVVVSASADMDRALRARQRVVLMQHGVGQSYNGRHASYPGGRKHDRCALVLMPNEVAAARHRRYHPDTPVEVVGSPRVDQLAAMAKKSRLAGGSTPMVAVTWHWPCKAVGNEGGTAFHYLGEAVLDELVAMQDRGDIYLMGHAHPRGVDMVENAYAERGITLWPDFADVIRCADLLIADNTSVLYEFPAATGRPVVVLDSPQWRRYLNMPPRFWSHADVGPRTSEPPQVPGLVRRALRREPADWERRTAIIDDLFPHRGEAASRAVDAIESHLGR